MPTSPALAALERERFVSLATFRRSGVAVATPVWIARDGEDLIVTTPKQSGKVKRLRNDPRVELVPCDRRGRVAPGAVPVPGRARIVSDPDTVERLGGIFAAKYRLEYRIFMVIEKLVARGAKERVMLRISSS